MRPIYSGHKFDCRTKYEIGDIVFMRIKNYKIIKAGPIEIKGIELRVDSKGKQTVWYNCESVNFYKFYFQSKGSKHYVKENELFREDEVDKMGYDIESRGLEDSYNPDGTLKTEEERKAYTLEQWKKKGFPNAKIVQSEYGWSIELGDKQ